jgi:tetratricopeptide (TPR) repeat protein
MTGFLLENCFDVNARWPIGAGPYWAMLGVLAGFMNRPVLGVAGAQTAEARAAENDDENPAVEPVWSPSPVQSPVLWVVCGLCVFGAIWTTAHSINFFLGSKANNDGLAQLGEPSPPEARGPILAEYDRLQQVNSDLRKPGLSAEARKTLITTRDRSLALYQQCRNAAIEDFQIAIGYNSHFVTSYYKLASVQSMGDGLGIAEHDVADLKAALDTYHELQNFTPDFSQIRLNLGIINSRLGRMTQDTKYDREALKNFRLAVRETINIQAHQSSETEMFCSALLPDAKAMRLPWRLEAKDLPQPAELAKGLMDPRNPAAVSIAQRLPEKVRQTLADRRNAEATEGEWVAQFAEGLNTALSGSLLYEEKAWQRVALSRRTLERMEAQPDAEEIGFLNRALLAQAFPDLVTWVPADEAVEAAARLRHAWSDLLVNKVPVRRSEGEVKGSITKSAQLETGIERDAGWTREAVRTLRAVEALGLDDEVWLSDVVAIFTDTHDDAGLAAFLEQYVERQPEVVSARLDLAVVLARLGRLREAERQASVVAALDPTRGDAHYVLFDVARQAGDQAAAAREGGLYLKAGKNNAWKQAIEAYLKQQ